MAIMFFESKAIIDHQMINEFYVSSCLHNSDFCLDFFFKFTGVSAV